MGQLLATRGVSRHLANGPSRALRFLPPHGSKDIVGETHQSTVTQLLFRQISSCKTPVNPPNPQYRPLFRTGLRSARHTTQTQPSSMWATFVQRSPRSSSFSKGLPNPLGIDFNSYSQTAFARIFTSSFQKGAPSVGTLAPQFEPRFHRQRSTVVAPPAFSRSKVAETLRMPFSQRRTCQTTPYQYERNFIEKTTISREEGVIWISNVYLLGQVKNIQRMAARIAGQENKFDFKVHEDIMGSFSSLEFPAIRQIIPSVKDNGCYITFATQGQAQQVYQAIKLTGITIGKAKRPAYLVKGRPFIEDITALTPSPKIRIDIANEGNSIQRLSEELLFKETRRYGPVQKITINDKKTSGTVLFSKTASAISARNCLHQMLIGDTKLLINFENYHRLHWITDFLSNAKIMIPLIGISTTLSIYLLVEPTRIASVTQKVARGYADPDFTDLLHSQQNYAPRSRVELRESLASLFKTKPDSAVIITGPSGAGKSQMMQKLCNSRTFATWIDCSAGDTPDELIESIGKSIGFSPSFNALNTMLVTIESVLPGFKKAGLSPSLRFQFESMLTTLERSLLLLQASSPVIVFDSLNTVLNKLYSDKADEREKARMILEMLFEFTNRNTKRAHIVFVVENYLGEELIKQNPMIKREKCFTFHLDDIPKSEAREFLQRYLKNAPSENELEYVIKSIGGRISDLEGLVHRCNSGFSVEEAIEDVVRGAELELRGNFGGQLWGTKSDYKWTQVQLWKTIKALVANPSLSYDTVLINCFKGDNQALTSLVRTHLLHVQLQEERKTISPVSPLYWTAFQRLVSNHNLANKMDILALRSDIDSLKRLIKDVEDELVQLWKAEKSANNSLKLPGISERRKSLDERLLHLSKKVCSKERELNELENK